MFFLGNGFGDNDFHGASWDGGFEIGDIIEAAVAIDLAVLGEDPVGFVGEAGEDSGTSVAADGFGGILGSFPELKVDIAQGGFVHPRAIVLELDEGVSILGF